MATCFNHHLAYELTMPDPTSYPGFAFMITTFREDGSKCDDYSYNATWGSAYVYSLWLSRLANLPQPSGILDRTPGLMDVLNQFMRHPGYMVTTRTARNHYPCVTSLTLSVGEFGLTAVAWPGDRSGFIVSIYSPLVPPHEVSFWGTNVIATSPFDWGNLPPDITVQAEMLDPVTGARVATSNQLTIPHYSYGPITVTVPDTEFFIVTWPCWFTASESDIQFKILETDDWTDLGNAGAIRKGVPVDWGEFGWFWRIRISDFHNFRFSDWSNTFFL